MWIVSFALRRPLSVAVMALLMLVLGVLSFTRMNADIFPAIDMPVVIVVWSYPGLSAFDMERRVVIISERAMSTTVNDIEHHGVGIDRRRRHRYGCISIRARPRRPESRRLARCRSRCWRFFRPGWSRRISSITTRPTFRSRNLTSTATRFPSSSSSITGSTSFACACSVSRDFRRLRRSADARARSWSTSIRRSSTPTGSRRRMSATR